MSEKQKVYLLKAGDYYKIGVSNNINERIKQLQTGCPHKITCIGKIEYCDALKTEKRLHRMFKDSNTYGEWYKPDNISQMILQKIFGEIGECSDEELKRAMRGIYNK